MKKLKVLMLTRLFPSRRFPTLGTFCLERARALAKVTDLKVMVPTPWFPRHTPGPARWRAQADVERGGKVDGSVSVTYPRYLSVPKLLTASQGLAMAESARRHARTAYGRWRPDVVDAHFAFPDGYAALAVAKHFDCALAVTCHGSDLLLYPGLPFTGEMVAKVMRKADRVISVSKRLLEDTLDLGCPEDAAALIHNGVDPSKFKPIPKTDARQRLGLPLDRKIAVYVGQLIDRKDQSLALRSLDIIKSRGRTPPLLVLLGEGPNRERLRSEVGRLHLQGDVLMPGARPHDEVAIWMAAADWLLLTSSYEGWATVYFEAMACGRPVLTSDVSSARDAICDPRYGRVVTPRTPAAFAEALTEAMQTELEPAPLRAYAERNSWDYWAKQAIQVLKDAVAIHGSGRGPGSPATQVGLAQATAGEGESGPFQAMPVGGVQPGTG